MNINNATPVSVATQVWNNSVRTLTSLGGALVVSGTQAGTIAASATLSLGAVGSACRNMSFGGFAGAAGSLVLSLRDGTFIYTQQTILAAGVGVLPSLIVNAGTFFAAQNNDAANAARYATCYYELS